MSVLCLFVWTAQTILACSVLAPCDSTDSQPCQSCAGLPHQHKGLSALHMPVPWDSTDFLVCLVPAPLRQHRQSPALCLLRRDSINTSLLCACSVGQRRRNTLSLERPALCPTWLRQASCSCSWCPTAQVVFSFAALIQVRLLKICPLPAVSGLLFSGTSRWMLNL